MRKFLALLAAGLVLAGQPSVALSQRIIVPPTPSSSGANQNLDNTYENVGIGADGLGVLFTTILGNTPTAYASIGTLSTSAKGGWLIMGPASSSSSRYMVSLKQNGAGGGAEFLTNFYVEGITTGVARAWIPAAIAAGELHAKIQGEAAGRTLRVSFEAALTNSQSAPLYSICELLNADTANTRPTNNVTVRASGTTFDTVVDPTTDNYGALIFNTASSGTTPGTAGTMGIAFGAGAASSEVTLVNTSYWLQLAATQVGATGRYAFQIDKAVVTNQRLAVKAIQAGAAGTDTIRISVMGCR